MVRESYRSHVTHLLEPLDDGTSGFRPFGATYEIQKQYEKIWAKSLDCLPRAAKQSMDSRCQEAGRGRGQGLSPCPSSSSIQPLPFGLFPLCYASDPSFLRLQQEKNDNTARHASRNSTCLDSRRLCFVPNGMSRYDLWNIGVTKYAPCMESSHSMCCNTRTKDECRPNGLCWNPRGRSLWRGSFIDPTWESHNCLKLCIGDQTGESVPFALRSRVANPIRLTASRIISETLLGAFGTCRKGDMKTGV